MSFVMAYYFATFVVILIMHGTIFPVKGQCTVPGCDNGDPLVSIVAEIQQLRVELFDQLNKQVQSIHEVLNASFQEMKSSVITSLQAVDRRRSLEHDIDIKQDQRFHEFLNASFQAMKSQHDTVNTSLQAVDRCHQEHDIYSNQFQRIQETLNQSFQEIKSQHGIVTSLQAVDLQRSQEQDIYIKQSQSFHELLNESFQEIKSQHGTIITSLQTVDLQRSQEHDIYIKQGQIIHELLNKSFQEIKSQHGTIITSLQTVDLQRSQEHEICIKQGQSIHERFNESFQEIKSQHSIVMTSLQAVDLQRSMEHNIYIKQSQSVHELLNESFEEMKSKHCSVQTSIHELLNESLQRMKSQYDTVSFSLQAVDQRLQKYQIDIKNQTQKSWKLVNDIWGAVYPVRDCSDIKARGHTVNGVYEVCVGHQSDRVCTNAFCDMETTNSAWLVFQRRKDGSVNFNRTWTGYKQGFGNPNGEFWLGNEVLYLLTSKRNYKLRVDLEDFEGRKGYAEYARFSINSSDDNYRLTVSGYSGNAGNSLNYHNGKQFSTNDVDNDDYGGNCARQHRGAWWYGGCIQAHLNGIYRQRYDTVPYAMGIHWIDWHNSWTYSLKATEMKLVPVA